MGDLLAQSKKQPDVGMGPWDFADGSHELMVQAETVSVDEVATKWVKTSLLVLMATL